MAHADHFLQRLTRIESTDDVDFALSLYRNTALLEYLLSQLRLADSTERVALSLKAGDRGPFLVVDRLGGFVTCLAEGMQHDLHVVSRQHLDHLIGKVDRLGAELEQSRQSIARHGSMRGLLHQVMTAGPNLAREDLMAVLAWQPLLATDLHLLLLETHARLDELSRDLRAHGRGAAAEASLRQFWQLSWAIGHLVVLVGSGDRPQLDQLAHKKAGLLAGLGWLASSTCLSAITMRGAWTVARVGKLALDEYTEQRLPSVQDPFAVIESSLSLCALGLRQGKLRGAVRRALKMLAQRSRDFDDARVAAYCVRLTELARSSIDGRDALLAASISGPDQGLASALRDAQPYVDRAPQLIAMFEQLPLVVGCGVEQLYLSSAEIEADQLPFDAEQARVMVAARPGSSPSRRPAQSPPRPGRNAPCPCGSGKKYKRCCGAAG